MRLDEMLFLDQLAQQSWPAASTTRIPGWALRHTPCVGRRRSNTAVPTHPDTRATDESTRAIVEFYRHHRLVPRIQVTPAQACRELDDELRVRGWDREAPTEVLVSSPAVVVAAGRPNVSGASLSTVGVNSSPHAGWLDAWLRISGTADALSTYQRVISRIRFQTGYAIAREADRPVGVGLAVVEGGWAGLFCMVVEPSRRGHGVGRHLLAALAEWSERRAVRGLYLQVEEDNAGAQTLYAKAGFARSHGYHYRAAPNRDVPEPSSTGAAAVSDAR